MCSVHQRLRERERLTYEDMAVPPYFAQHELHLLEGETGLPPLEAYSPCSPSSSTDIGVPRHGVQHLSTSQHTLDSTWKWNLGCKMNTYSDMDRGQWCQACHVVLRDTAKNKSEEFVSEWH